LNARNCDNENASFGTTAALINPLEKRILFFHEIHHAIFLIVMALL